MNRTVNNIFFTFSKRQHFARSAASSILLIMKCTMADDGIEFTLFSVGTVVYCRTCFNQEYEGEVMAFDFPTKVLVLKCPSSNGKANINDVHIINLDYVEDVVVKKEAPPASANGTAVNLPPLNIEKLAGRAKQNIKDKQRLVAALSSGVSPEGVKLFTAITKTINEVTWQGKNIVVMNQVTITPPYRPENCKAIGRADSDAVNHVRKIVEKYMKDQVQAQASPSQVVPQHPQQQQQQQPPTQGRPAHLQQSMQS